MMNQMKPSIIAAFFWKILEIFLIIFIATIIIFYLVSLEESTSVAAKVWKVVIIILASIINFLAIFHAALHIKSIWWSIGIKDIQIYCNQTELDKYSKNSREILSDFLNKVYYHKKGDTNFEYPIDLDHSQNEYSMNSSRMRFEKKKNSYMNQMEDFSGIKP